MKGKGLYENLDYKSSYNLKNFSLDVLKDAIGDYFFSKYGQRDIPYHIQLQDKLNNVRSKIDYDEMWYTPTLEELKEGDVVSVLSSWGWIEGIFPSILYEETHVNMASYRAKDDSVEFRFKNVTIRKRK